jgi:hypothetical protein
MQQYDILADDNFSAIDRIYSYLNGQDQSVDEQIADLAVVAFKHGLMRQLMEEREEVQPGKLRCSNPGPCARKMAYAYLGTVPDGKKIDARAKLTFLNGDLLEVVIVVLLKLAGIKTEGTILDEGGQPDLWFDAGDGVLVPGHGDGILPVQEGLSTRTLLEVKSCSDWAFKNKFSKGIVGDDYMLQHQTYMEATTLVQGLFIAANKNSGELVEVHTYKDPEFLVWARQNYQLAVHSTPENLPPRYDDGDSYGLKVVRGEKTDYLAALCGYCSYYNSCWNHPQIEFKYGKPIFKVIDMPEDYVCPTA